MCKTSPSSVTEEEVPCWGIGDAGREQSITNLYIYKTGAPMLCWASLTGHIHAAEHGPGHHMSPCTMPARLRSAPVCNMLGLHSVSSGSTGGKPWVSASIYPDIPSANCHGENRHGRPWYFPPLHVFLFIVVALFLWWKPSNKHTYSTILILTEGLSLT